jgi:phosphopantothenoylcysteine decarboxylase/phosphopantothenate--cysteine ligase
MIVSGPTVEAIDPVRYISNHSSGLTGYHLAMSAVEMGFEPRFFITGPSVHLPQGVGETIKVQSADQMRAAVLTHLSEVKVVIMAAAVSDYRPLSCEPQKIKKDGLELLLRLVKNPDILAELGRVRLPGQVIVGFAAETEKGPEHAREKLLRKGADLIVLNLIGPGNPAFGNCPNQASLVTREGIEHLPSLEKAALARSIWQKIATLTPLRSEERP